MRRIVFNEETIGQIRNFLEVEHHTIQETCNRFTLKKDTLYRVMHEHNISCGNPNKASNIKVIDEETKQKAYKLFDTTEMSFVDMRKELHLRDYQLQEIFKEHYTQEQIDRRHSLLYHKSKLGTNNPMKGKFGELHHNYKGLVEDGNGYYMILKPSWYTGRKGSKYIFYHHYVFCQNAGLTEIPKGYVVHHIDFNKKNNDIHNLCLMTMEAHSRLHQSFIHQQGAETILNGVG